MKKLFLSLVIVMVAVTSTLMYVFSTPSIEEAWKLREEFWREQEMIWERELEDLQKEREQLDLVLSKRFIDQKYLSLLPYKPSNSHAIVTAFGYEGSHSEATPQWILALTLFQSLNETKCRVPNKVALSYHPLDQIPDIGKNAFRRLGVDLKYAGNSERREPNKDWTDIWMRTKAFAMTEFSHVLFMDSHSIAVNNIDHVFETEIPSDHMGEDFRLIFTSVQQEECTFWESCGTRSKSSPRFLLLRPNMGVGNELETKINSKGDEVSLNMFTHEMTDILMWTPFPTDLYDWQLGECDCSTFTEFTIRTISFSCLRKENIFDDVFGRMWMEKSCSHKWFILWIQLYSILMEKLSR